ncbi:hypothetical protein SDC9_135013 [bioreactor metagenome]|uniref:DUF4405 domain-containing protein n=1 Tax=bioreactor metagenome TaxID=1076179 RepID=A0A645DH49_9ZZZZ|nr:DUF4405 domain-containing protein [Oscillospiraceae bacterium]
MKKRTYEKLILDAVMTVLYIILMFDFGTGALFHEVAGISIGILFALHIALNYQRIKSMLLSALKGKKAGLKQTVLLWSDIILTTGMLTTIFTGILIAKELFLIPGINILIVFTVHKLASYIGLGILTFHLLLHIKYIAAILGAKSMRSDEAKKSLRGAAGSFFKAAAAAVCIYGVVFISVRGKEADVYPVSAVSGETDVNQPDESATGGLQPVITEDNGNITESGSSFVTGASGQNDVPTIEAYLSKLFCTGCSRRCPLTSPRCSTGMQKAEEAKQEYYSLYGGE